MPSISHERIALFDCYEVKGALRNKVIQDGRLTIKDLVSKYFIPALNDLTKMQRSSKFLMCILLVNIQSVGIYLPTSKANLWSTQREVEGSGSTSVPVPT